MQKESHLEFYTRGMQHVFENTKQIKTRRTYSHSNTFT